MVTKHAEASALTHAKCLVCKATFERKTMTRGLCDTDYGRFRTVMRGLPKEERQAYDQLCVENGVVLPSNQGKRRREGDVFTDLLAEFRKELKDPRDRQVFVEGAEAMEEQKKRKK